MYAAGMQALRIPFGPGHIAFEAPRTWRVETASSPSPPEVTVEALAREALARPVAGPRLRDLARPGMRVTLVVPDATRACPTPPLLEAMWAELAAAGVREDHVTLLVALGMHRRLENDERRALLGLWASRFRVDEAQGNETGAYRDLGSLPSEAGVSIPLRLHHLVLDCDLLLAIGLVEPHQLAGFSGGRKTVAIGCAGADTIAALHGSNMLEHAGTRLGNLENNPLHLALERIAERIGLRFVLNIAQDGGDHPLAAAAGEPRAVLADLVRRAGDYFWSSVAPGPYDAVFAGIAPPKDTNLYQATRAQTYIAFAREPLVREEGWIVSAAACMEGAGRGPGETEFLRLMQAGRSAAEIVERLRVTAYGAGGQRAFLVAKALLHHRLLMVGLQDPSLGRSCHLDTAANAREAMAKLVPALGADARVLVVPNALGTLPVPLV
jgi:lactate racemase